MTLEEEIARVIDKAFDDWQGEESEATFVTGRLTPLLNRVRAEALREAAAALDERFQDIPAWVEAYREGVRTDEWMQGGVRMTMGAIGMLRTRADRIEGSSRG